MEPIQIKGRNNLVRDLESKALLVTESDRLLENYHKQTNKITEAKQHIQDIVSLKQEFNEMKTILQQILLKLG